MAYRLAFGRNPTAAELSRDQAALRELTKLWKQELKGADNPQQGVQSARRRALENYCHALLNSPELIYVD